MLSLIETNSHDDSTTINSQKKDVGRSEVEKRQGEGVVRA